MHLGLLDYDSPADPSLPVSDREGVAVSIREGAAVRRYTPADFA